ncbi:MAG TPA: DUF2905 family protein [Thermoanaerobaculia bacterium]|nr:DUF2905 family protein [Thermoanaerobaculia bacterium]
MIGEGARHQEYREPVVGTDPVERQAGSVRRSNGVADEVSFPRRRRGRRFGYDGGVAEIGRFLLIAGIAIAAIGGLVLAAGRLGARRIPGTLVVSGRHGTFVFPILLCIVLSLLLTILLSIFRR